MRPQKVLDIEILSGLTKVFRAKGYDGASLAELAEATGLKKASLYHRFPGGKQEMATAALKHIDEWVEINVFHVLKDKDRSPKNRLVDGVAAIRTLYMNGNEVCIFRALSMQSGLELFQQQIASGIHGWMDALGSVGTALELTNSESKDLALQSLIEIQGSLILTKCLNDLNIFENTLQKIEERYLKN